MERPLVLISLVVCVQGGPYIWRPRPIAKPAVVVAQWAVHQHFLEVEAQALQTSLDVSRLALSTTEEAYRLTDEARARLDTSVSALNQDVNKIKMSNPECIRPASLKKTENYMKNVTEDLYRCIHGISNRAVTYEVDMTLKVIHARTRVWDVEQAMWFCQRNLRKIDVRCLETLKEEGLEIVDNLPNEGEKVLEAAHAERAESLSRLQKCFAGNLSRAEERRVAETQKMRKCAEEMARKTSRQRGD